MYSGISKSQRTEKNRYIEETSSDSKHSWNLK